MNIIVNGHTHHSTGCLTAEYSIFTEVTLGPGPRSSVQIVQMLPDRLMPTLPRALTSRFSQLMLMTRYVSPPGSCCCEVDLCFQLVYIPQRINSALLVLVMRAALSRRLQ